MTVNAVLSKETAIAAVPALVSIVALALMVREAPRARPPAEHQAGQGKLGGSFWYLLAVLVLFTLGNSSDAFLISRAGTFGFSVDSGAPIPDERLEASPTAELTFEEEQRAEGR